MVIQDSDSLILKTLLEALPELYQSCQADRTRLHDWEWKQEAAHTVLGEVELRSTTIAGYASALQKPDYNGSRDLRAVVSGPQQASIHQSETLRNWMQTEAQHYPDFTLYMETLETLLWLAVKQVRQEVTQTNETDRGT
ncbi:hypothetical protein FYZ48_04780 [Gimesia chilikensis]|uniref:hypothetical protein n=1 Tax=Gimesia chilikensis TaxID=2605989 RepID=UPI0011EFE94D|nr:hypothetical protein [Gimesia chilikensis]KAA0140598.1 hypothetical protein FYZ48_04780 [Gimesia chilikensis]